MNKKQKTTIITTLIGGICTIIATAVGAYIGKENTIKEITYQVTNNVNIDSIDELITEYKQMSTDLSDLKDENTNTKNENESLKIENNELKKENESLKNGTAEFSYLVEENSRLLEENNSLKNQIEELETEIQTIKNTNPEGISPTENSQTNKKTSIFGLTTFRGYDRWYSRSDFPDSYFIDTYDNEYPNAHLGNHYSRSEDDLDSEPTYLLDGNYSKCIGHIAWSKYCKNDEGSAWIDFYSGTTLIGSSPVITADSRLTEFSCDVTGVEKLTVVINGSNNVYIIYSDFDLIE